MNSSSRLEKCLLFFMAFQTDIRTVFCIFAFKREEEPFPLRLRMLCSGTMAGFAFLSPVRIFLKKIVNVGMAPFAGLGSNIPFLLRLHLLLTK
jgi:hypothetical protein